MQNKLPARPNLDHLRRQAKTLLADLASGKPEAIATISEHLPAAKKLSADAIAKAQFRLADAQSAIARKSGFAAWPHLARHVEQLRAMEGTWTFERLVVEGNSMPAALLTSSRVLIDGDRFRTESPEANYEGEFNINVETDPHEIDIEFVAGPEAGNWNYGIFRLDGDLFELCLDLNGKQRPVVFGSTSGSGHAYETLKRATRQRPDNVSGGLAQPPKAIATATADDFAYVESPALTKLQGEWKAAKIVRDGMNLPKMMLFTASRSARKNEVKISVAGQLVIHALIKLDESKTPTRVDYFNIGGPAKGTIQHGLFKWAGDEACFCIAAPGAPRPDSFDAPGGSGRSFSQWRLKR